MCVEMQRIRSAWTWGLPCTLLGILFLHSGCKSTMAPVPVYSSIDAIPTGDSRVVVIGDTQQTSHWEFWRERNEAETKRLLEEIARRDPAFVLHCGDLTTRGSSDKHWQWFDEACKPLRMKGIPILPAVGNHEYYGRNQTAFRHLRDRFPILREKTWYSFVHQGVGFIVLNSNLPDLHDAERASQLSWYQAELDRMDRDPAIRWVIVMFHRPPYTNSRVTFPSKAVCESLVPPFLDHAKTVLLFSGHCHAYERFVVGEKTFVVTGGGGGPRHRLYQGDRQRTPDQYEGSGADSESSSVRFFHFCELRIEPGRLILDVIRLGPDETFDLAESLAFPQVSGANP